MKIEHVVMAERFTDEERTRYRSHLCVHQTAHGMPGIEYCAETLSLAEMMRGSIECEEHERDAVSQGLPVLRLAYIVSASDAETGMRVSKWDGSEAGRVVEIDRGAVVVEFDTNPQPKVPGAKGCCFLSGALASGALVKDPRP